MLKKGELAPTFSGVNQDGQKVTLDDYKGNKNVILYFYPKDDTPGCTIQANQFSELVKDFLDNNTVILGVSKDNCDSHVAFIKKFDLKIDLLADTDGEICERYGVWQEKEKNGEKKMGIVRSTFLVDKQGVLQDVMYGVTPQGHASIMLDKVRELK